MSIPNIAELPRNPFTVKSPEELTSEQIVALFVREYTNLEIIKEKKHTFIWGSRGSGKSMMLRYLEPKCKSIIHGSLENFLKHPNAFLAVYCPCKEGQYNKIEFNLLEAIQRLVISEHLLSLTIAKQALNCLYNQIPQKYYSGKRISVFASRVLSLFDKASIASSVIQANEYIDRSSDALKWLDELFRSEITKVSRYLSDIVRLGPEVRYEAATTSYHDFFLPFFQALKELLDNKSISIYILLDDADHLSCEQQQIVNTWMANRDQMDLCFKVSSRREGYNTFQTRNRVEIDEVHDYSTVDVDELYTASKSDYARKVELIANLRLNLSAVATKNIEQFLPNDKTQEEMLENLKNETADEWATVGKPGAKTDYVKRYAIARLFQKLGHMKQRRNYAGFKNIVHLSSGIVRDFLEPCYLMFDKLLDTGKKPEDIDSIPPHIQNEVLFKYSENFLIYGIGELRKKTAPEKWGQLEALEKLMHSLGKVFYSRLHDPKSREPRLISFSVNGLIDTNTQEILDLGVYHRYFQLRSYSSKRGGGREHWYVLNRRLCPIFGLDPTGFEGRLTLNQEQIQLALNDPDAFIKIRLKIHEEPPEQQEKLFVDGSEK